MNKLPISLHIILKSCGVWARGRGVSKDRFFTLDYCNLARGPSDGASGNCMLTAPGNGTATNRGQSEDGLEPRPSKPIAL